MKTIVLILSLVTLSVWAHPENLKGEASADAPATGAATQVVTPGGQRATATEGGSAAAKPEESEEEEEEKVVREKKERAEAVQAAIAKDQDLEELYAAHPEIKGKSEGDLIALGVDGDTAKELVSRAEAHAKFQGDPREARRELINAANRIRDGKENAGDRALLAEGARRDARNPNAQRLAQLNGGYLPGEASLRMAEIRGMMSPTRSPNETDAQFKARAYRENQRAGYEMGNIMRELDPAERRELGKIDFGDARTNQAARWASSYMGDASIAGKPGVGNSPFASSFANDWRNVHLPQMREFNDAVRTYSSLNGRSDLSVEQAADFAGAKGVLARYGNDRNVEWAFNGNNRSAAIALGTQTDGSFRYRSLPVGDEKPQTLQISSSQDMSRLFAEAKPGENWDQFSGRLRRTQQQVESAVVSEQVGRASAAISPAIETGRQLIERGTAAAIGTMASLFGFGEGTASGPAAASNIIEIPMGAGAKTFEPGRGSFNPNSEGGSFYFGDEKFSFRGAPVPASRDFQATDDPNIQTATYTVQTAGGARQVTIQVDKRRLNQYATNQIGGTPEFKIVSVK